MPGEPKAGPATGSPPALLVLLCLAPAALALYGIVLMSDDAQWMNRANGSMPAALGALCLWTAYRMVRSKPVTLWTPVPWFLAAWTVYYGFGALAYVYGTPETVAYMDTFYPVDDRALLRTNVLNVVGLLVVISGGVLFSRMRIGLAAKQNGAGDDPWRVALLFLCIGVPVKYLLELPYALGLVDYVLPGSIQFLGTFSGLAILPLAVAASAGRRGARSLFWMLVAAEIAVGFVMLAKLHIIKTVLLTFLGQYAVRANLKRLIVTGLIVAIGYVAVLSPFVNFARTLLGRASAQSVGETVEAVQAFGAEGRETLADVLPGVQGWWARLAYANAQTFAMDQYDRGEPGWTFAMVGYVFVPRFLYAGKPIMTPGIDFTYLVQGTDTSSTGPGFFVAEAYWNGGWPVVILVGLFVGGLFAILGRFTIHAVRSRRWLEAPLIFTTIYLGLRPDDWFVPAYVGGVLQVIVVVLILRLVFSGLVRRRVRRPKDPKVTPSIGTSVPRTSP
ncbi:MAG: hypothetical protein Fur0039_15790 [Rhodocyclaceae bacterium]